MEITQEEYNKLIKRIMLLNALEAAGVDNWEGYEDAIEKLNFPATF